MSWDEWKQYVIQELDKNTQESERDLDYWMQQRMDYNYIDFNSDQTINKQELGYWLAHPVNLTMSTQQESNAVSMIEVPEIEDQVVK